MICNEELSNIYLHCIGCENLLSKDFNICTVCHEQQKYHKLFIMDHENRDDYKFQHISCRSNLLELESRNCLCHTRCSGCRCCKVCSCQCHTNFSLNFRFMNIEDEKKMLEDVTTECDTATMN